MGWLPTKITSRAQLVRALTGARWIISVAARDLGTSRQAVYDAMGRYRVPRKRNVAALHGHLRKMAAKGAPARMRKAQEGEDAA